MLTSLLDCGMSHFPDAKVREALLEVNPNARDVIESMDFGEIRNG
jgi:hypothetical protein